MNGKIVGMFRSAVLGEIGRRTKHHEPKLAQTFCLQRRVRDFPDTHRQIETFLDEVNLPVRNLELDRGIALDEVADRRGRIRRSKEYRRAYPEQASGSTRLLTASRLRMPV